MKVHIWGTDFRRSSADFRKKLWISETDRDGKIRECLDLGFGDLLYLTTCNRIEFYTTMPDYFIDSRPLWMALLRSFGLTDEDFYRGYHLEGKSALRHLLRVACSLESLVVGESQILGQLKDMFQSTKTSGLPLHPSLERTFLLAFETAKRVRTETAIGEKPVSVATLGLQRLIQEESSRPLHRAVVVGRSPISVLTIEWLKENRPTCEVVWINRSLEKIKNLNQSEGVTLQSLESFLKSPCDFSHLFTATSSPEPIFTESFFQKLGSRDRVVFDFAQPADVGSVECPRVEVIRLENLKEQAQTNRESRALAVLQAEKLIESAMREHVLVRKEAPLLRDFSHVEPKLQEELKEINGLIEQEFPSEWHTKLKKLADKIVKRHLHLSREHLRSILRTLARENVPNDSFVDV